MAAWLAVVAVAAAVVEGRVVEVTKARVVVFPEVTHESTRALATMSFSLSLFNTYVSAVYSYRQSR
jgi:hypothetical protein